MVDKETEVANKIFYEILGSKEEALKHFKAAGTLIIADTFDRVLLGGHECDLRRFQGYGRPEKPAWEKVVRWVWGNPAGSKEGNESAWETAYRETREEFGIECPDLPEYPPLIMVVYEDLDRPVSLEALDIGVCYPVIMKPSLYRPKGELKRLEWFTRNDLLELTKDFRDDFWLWGGAWTEMILMRWSRRAEEDLNQFSGMITFSRWAQGRWSTPYNILRGRGVSTRYR